MLNAFRHHGSYRVRSAPPPTSPARGCWGAQRLSASRIISAWAILTAAPTGNLCSTPFGITDHIGMHHTDHHVAAGWVLNAFRHHGSYRTGAACRPTGSCPDVLNAFRHHGSYRTAAASRLPCVLPPRAQRLSASRIISGGRPMRSRPTSAQRLSASRIISGPAAPRRTCRRGTSAQRLSASRIISVEAVLRQSVLREVLNAFRHHGSYRLGRIIPRGDYV